MPSVLKVKLAQLVIWVSQDSEDHVDARVTRESVVIVESKVLPVKMVMLVLLDLMDFQAQLDLRDQQEMLDPRVPQDDKDQLD